MSTRSSPINGESNTAYLKLINLVKTYPVLYTGNDFILDSQNFRRNQKDVNRSWQLVATELGISVGECKRRWKTLKETFLRVHKRNLENAEEKKWIYEDAMSFLLNSNDNTETQSTEMETVIQINPESEEIHEGTVEYLELDMNSMGDAEYYIMDSSISNKEVIEIATPIQSNQVIVNNQTVPKYITICNSSQNGLENATLVNLEDLQKNNFIVTTPMIKGEETVEYIAGNIIDNNVQTAVVNGVEVKVERELKDKVKLEKMKTKKKYSNVSPETLRRIKRLLKTPGSDKSIESFFENISQVVTKLPLRVQNQLKTDIFNIITAAQVKAEKLKDDVK